MIVQRMAVWANVLKVIQFASIAAASNWVAASTLSPLTWAAIIGLIAYGQHLNVLVFKLLGRDGVYYGSRFGKSLPWISAYPYNTMRDPQYIGSIITLAGCAFVIPVGTSRAPQGLAHWQCGSIMITAVHLPAPSLPIPFPRPCRDLAVVARQLPVPHVAGVQGARCRHRRRALSA